METEPENSTVPRALVLFGYPLTPDQDAASLRMYYVLQLLLGLNWQIDLAVNDLLSTPAQTTLLRSLGVRALDRTNTATLEGHLEARGSAYALILMSSVSVAYKYLDAILKHAPRARLIFDTTDLQHVRQYRRAKLTGNAGWLQLAARTKKWEVAATRVAHVTLVVSPEEQALLEQECRGANIQILPLIYPTHRPARPFAGRQGLLFVGSFPHHPNSDAMQFFLDEVYPLLKPPLDQAPVWIVGPQPPEWLRARATDSLRVMGHVPDLASLYDACKLSLAPLRYGAGVKGKVLQSMSYGLPVVGTSVAAEGLGVVNGREMLVADRPGDLVEGVVRLCEDESLWNQLSQNGLALVERSYSLSAAHARLVQVLESVGLLHTPATPAALAPQRLPSRACAPEGAA